MVSNKDEVSEWERILYSALYNEGIITSPQYPVDKYKLDLALFSGNKKLDIEIDGEMYHKDWNGELCYRDQLRNHRLFELGWDVKRFWVYQVRDELQWCLAQIQAWVNLSNSESNDNQRSDNN
jgi:very-short-patch-repair endonuclease